MEIPNALTRSLDMHALLRHTYSKSRIAFRHSGEHRNPGDWSHDLVRRAVQVHQAHISSPEMVNRDRSFWTPASRRDFAYVRHTASTLLPSGSMRNAA